MNVEIEIRRHAPVTDDGELTQNGKSSVEKIKNTISDRPDRILTSPLDRARATVEALGFDSYEEDPALSVLPAERLAPFRDELERIQQRNDITPVEAYFQHNDAREILQNHARDFLGSLMTHLGMLNEGSTIFGISHGETMPAVFALISEGDFSLETAGQPFDHLEGFQLTFENRRIQTVERLPVPA